MLKGIILGALSLIALAFILFCFWVQPAVAQVDPSTCAPRRELIDSLKATYGETESWVGKDAKDKAAVFLLMTGKNGSWTLLKVMPDVACVIAAGSESTNLFGTPV
ncbi:hypothetical protein SJ05684_c10920 [Sinorhizobium sojae CCBAU 05684]|uniref:Uncharacterized protein n=1 Tax=Sinorhizobium sojae CCBAU 05684 TaxID=716928 RepID=A0A249PB93_9HYPH|nr:hypothetical protein [Sinorhizobium sojae]ASY62549.1 hypothetical protein SJ05684_c10920 [Sinorhizobium sojae CCBAU 05684]